MHEDVDAPVPEQSEGPEPWDVGAVVCGCYTLRAIISRHEDRIVYAVTEGEARRWCPVCEVITHQASEDEFCDECGAELIHGHYRLTEWPVDDVPEGIDLLVRDGVTHPGCLRPLETFVREGRRYMIQSDPGGGPVASMEAPASHGEVLSWGVTLSEALQVLHAHGFAGFSLRPDDMIVTPGRRIMMANFPEIAVYPNDPPFSEEAQVEARRQDITRLASLITAWSVGNGGNGEAAADEPGIDPVLEEKISRMAAGAYADARAVAEDLRALQAAEAEDDADRAPPVIAEPPCNLTYRVGSRSDIGRVRDLNEDSLATIELSFMHESRRCTVGLYVLADGMGGHEGGEIASRIAVHAIGHAVIDRIVRPEIDEEEPAWNDTRYTALLTDAVRAANQAVLAAGARTETDMGATVTAALIVGASAYIANVGDSRTYLYRAGALAPLTADHSLVARLVAMGMLHADEVYTHPQRNQIYRALGDIREVEVDTFIHPLEPEDRLLLCSDGLWEMVRDPETEATLRKAASPQAACDTLIELANAHGGEDNVSVIVIQAFEMERERKDASEDAL